MRNRLFKTVVVVIESFLGNSNLFLLEALSFEMMEEVDDLALLLFRQSFYLMNDF